MSPSHILVGSLEKSSGYCFSDKSLAERAITHTSYAYQKGLGRQASNERLEYLGDALLKAYIARHLYLSYPEDEEGALSTKSSNALSGASLAKAARQMGLNLIMRMSAQEEASGGRHKPRNLAGCFEALVAAIYLDGGFDPMDDFLERVLIPAVTEELESSQRDPKSTLQEMLQGSGRGLPEYVVEGRTGPDHNPVFYVMVTEAGRELGRGSGSSIKEAEQKAASDAISREYAQKK
ncbi:MAG TPA: ribonuclease III [Bacillota bacterium]|nr:MAG: Ribonuclease 3 [Firmicutes bacterium ADurb.Bin153]HNV35122.1 ribonuclease III [Bacillota bacterium]